ncbi:1198_t:CDS:2, partial [Racocetra persica]
YTSQQVDKNCALKIENKDESLNTGLIEDTIDILLIVLKELIPTDRYNNIVKIWELEPSVNTLQTETFLEMPYKMVNIPYEHVYNSLNQQKEYAIANRLSKKKLPRRNSKTLLAKSYNIPGSSDESDSFDSSDSNYDNDELDSQDIENINPSLIRILLFMQEK